MILHHFKIKQPARRTSETTHMNKLLIGIAVVAGFTLYACCKAECIKDNTLTVIFQNFKHRDTDTVLLVRYKKGASITQPLDSTWKYSAPVSPDTAWSQLNLMLQSDTDWQVYIPALNKRYMVSDLNVASSECNCERGRSVFVRSYKLDGTEQMGSLLFLR
jgi:hypothetical protein